CYHHSSGWTF
nr:immunoglobulin light chain junction region [Macaca mulatta]MPN91237.1 immunoglobulin light chain junction region [Macaca mulatta]MPN92284.1 immunoglobulin light chain junction region [Macaca mulatta]MPN92452.1 immunoglobulin light chain junction region [Macaca mulatta]MPN92465.1 immunoglobulin light chain junction region [Macaca mulatta]